MNNSSPAVAAPIDSEQAVASSLAEPMTLKDRLRNPMWVSPPDIVGSASLSVDETRADMDEAANEIERLEKALEIRNAEVVDALKWLPKATSADETLAALKTLVAQHDQPHGFADEHWYARALEPARAAIAKASKL